MLPQACLNELSMIALHALQVYDGLCQGGAKGRSPLTKRELDVVRWTAQEKTSVEIADLFSISEHTVNALHEQRHPQAGTVSTASKLVAKAIRLRLINYRCTLRLWLGDQGSIGRGQSAVQRGWSELSTR